MLKLFLGFHSFAPCCPFALLMGRFGLVYYSFLVQNYSFNKSKIKNVCHFSAQLSGFIQFYSFLAINYSSPIYLYIFIFLLVLLEKSVKVYSLAQPCGFAPYIFTFKTVKNAPKLSIKW